MYVVGLLFNFSRVLHVHASVLHFTSISLSTPLDLATSYNVLHQQEVLASFSTGHFFLLA